MSAVGGPGDSIRGRRLPPTGTNRYDNYSTLDPFWRGIRAGERNIRRGEGPGGRQHRGAGLLPERRRPPPDHGRAGLGGENELEQDFRRTI
jgi:hypothetical protein